MTGKILKIMSNDLYGNVDDRKVSVFACFEDTKYMNNYVIFAFEGEYEKNRLYYGSVHLKSNSIVIFSIKESEKKIIDKFIQEYLESKLNEFKIIDISNAEKVELVSYNNMEYKELKKLDELSIVRKKNDEVIEEKNKKPIGLYLLLLLLILSSIGLTLLYMFPEKFTIKYKELVCSNTMYDENIMLNYNIEKDIKFDSKDKIVSINTIREYVFLLEEDYLEFKNNDKKYEYFNSGEGYKFIDENLSFKVIYNENSVIDDYEEMLTYLKKEGYNCIEKYYER